MPSFVCAYVKFAQQRPVNKCHVPQVSLKFTLRLMTACLFGYSKRNGDINKLIYFILG